MSKSVLTKRKISILPSCKSDQIKAALDLLDAETGIYKISFDNQDNSILAEYDLRKVTYSKIEGFLIAQKICQPTGIKRKLLATWYDYMDTTARDNALAPPAPCCNKPPRRTK